MKLKTSNTFGHYSEECQPNLLSWMLMKEVKEGEYENIAGVMKCKDYFNDVAVTLQTGKPIVAYGFTTENLGLDKEKPVSILLTNLTNSFENNLTVFNKYLDEHILPTITYTVVQRGVLIAVDPWYWKNTYRISLLTLIIRLLNVDTKFNSFKEIESFKQFNIKDQGKWDKVVAKGIYFHIPEKWNKFSWYAGGDYNSEKCNDLLGLATVIHNNGVLSWMGYL